MPHGTVERELDLRAGELVEVRSKEEILDTLDENGTLDAMPFMPEMLAFCGKRFHVVKRADKVCDTIAGTGLRRVENAVLLDDLRCDGQAHGGCQAGCLIFWKEAWLRRVDTAVNGARPLGEAHSPAAGGPGPGGRPEACTEEALYAATTSSAGSDADGPTYSCQATDLSAATTGVVPPWAVGQYVQDIRSGNVGLVQFVRGFVRSVFFPSKFGHPLLKGTLAKSPSAKLDLQPGELVRVKSRKAILETIDTQNKNRGLNFDVHMLKYCGKEARVLRRVNSIIDERTGKMIHIKSDCIVLEGFVCEGDYRRFCPRRIYPYWREIWLERVAEQPSEKVPA
jgi:hypothetical protein